MQHAYKLLQWAGWALLITAVLLGLRAIDGSTPTAGTMVRSYAVMLLYVFSLYGYSIWLARQRQHCFGGWKKIAAKGKLHFLLCHGMPARGWTLGLVVLGLDWADGGRLFASEFLLLGLLIWSAAGMVLASSDWTRMQRACLAEAEG